VSRVSAFMIGWAVCSSTFALEHAPVGQGTTDSCADIADKVCSTEDVSKVLGRAGDLAQQAKKDLDSIAESVLGDEWKARMLARLKAEGFTLKDGQSDADVTEFFKKLYLPQAENSDIDIFSNATADVCLSDEVSDADAEKNLQDLWASSGGPSLSLLDGTLIAASGSASNLENSRRYREAVGAFKRSEPARSLMKNFDAWGLPGDSAQKAKDTMASFKNYFEKEFAFVSSQRAQTLSALASDKARVLRISRLCALMTAMQGSSGDCHAVLVDTTPEGIMLKVEPPVSDRRVAEFEDQVLRKFEESGEESLEILKAGLDSALFPRALPSSYENPKTLMASLLAQNAPTNFDAKESLKAGLSGFGETPHRNRVCDESFLAAASRLRAIVNEFHDDLQLSKPYLQKARAKIYSPETLAKQRSQFDAAKMLLGKVVDQKLMPLVVNPAKRGLVKNSLSNVEMHVPPPVEELPFTTRPGSSFPVLDLRKVDRMPRSTTNFYEMLIRNTGEGVDSANAFYTPEMNVGMQKDPKNVFVYPGMMEAYKDRPAGLLGVWAHEIGHNFGPEISKLNGHDMRPELQKLLECLKKSHALAMSDHQSDECIADWLATESMGMLLDDPSLRRQTGVPQKDYDFAHEFIAPYCMFMDQGIGSPTDGVHPSARRRINGILGAHPRIRAALGCKGEGKAYCTLEGKGGAAP